MTRNNGAGPAGHHPATAAREISTPQLWRAGLVGGLLEASGRFEREARRRIFPSGTGAARAWEWLEQTLGHRIAQALNALQIPTFRDVQELNRRVEALHVAVIALERRAAAAKLSATPPQENGPGRKPVRRAKPSSRKKSGS